MWDMTYGEPREATTADGMPVLLNIRQMRESMADATLIIVDRDTLYDYAALPVAGLADNPLFRRLFPDYHELAGWAEVECIPWRP